MPTLISNIYAKLPTVSLSNVKSLAIDAKNAALDNRVTNFVSNFFRAIAGVTLAGFKAGWHHARTAVVSVTALPTQGKLLVGGLVAAAIAGGVYLAKNCNCFKQKPAQLKSMQLKDPNEPKGASIGEIRDLNAPNQPLSPTNVNVPADTQKHTVSPKKG